MNAALEDVYKKVFADSYRRALQLKHEINVESTIIQRGTTKRDRDQPLVYRVPNLRFFKYPIPVGASKLD